MERTNYRRGVDLVDLVVLQGCELESNLCTSSLKLIGFRLDERIEKKCRSTAHKGLVTTSESYNATENQDQDQDREGSLYTNSHSEPPRGRLTP